MLAITVVLLSATVLVLALRVGALHLQLERSRVRLHAVSAKRDMDHLTARALSQMAQVAAQRQPW